MRIQILLVASALCLVACNGEIYVRDGVTDGDTFYLAERALTDSDPVLQSWVAYSLGVSACQLQHDTDNPARASSFDCELSARELLLETWREKQALDPSLSNPYLDDLEIIDNAGFLPEHVAQDLNRSSWSVPQDLRVRAYRDWARDVIPGLEPETRIIGSWNYARNVSSY
jgi:hypothetical protein